MLYTTGHLTLIPIVLTKLLNVTIQMNATEQYVPVVLFIMLYKVVLTFENVDEILKWSIIFCGRKYQSVPTN